MAGRRATAVDEESRSYAVVWLVCAGLLFTGALWALWDDNIARRPWKFYQAEFNRLEIARLEAAIRAEQERLDADPAYQQAAKALADARAHLASGENARTLRSLERELERAMEADQSKDLNLRFVKSELEELRFLYDDAKHHGHEAKADELLEKIHTREELQQEREQAYAESQARIEELQGRIKALQDSVKTAEAALAKLTTARDDLQQKLEGVSLGYLPGPKRTPPFVGMAWQPKIPKIQQVVLEEFDRGNFDQPLARVDRCTSCHAGIDKAGFEDQPNPWKTHPHREELLGRHPPEKFGCTPCHDGQGPAVNSPEQAHGNFIDAHGHVENVEFIDRPLKRGEEMQSNCIECHAGVQRLPGAEAIARGEQLFVELGCHGCHLTEGYEELAKENGVAVIAPSLRRIGAKADRGWLVRWVTNPHQFRPRTRMPNFMFDQTEAVQIAAFLLAASREASEAWTAAHPAPTIVAGGELAVRGRQLVDTAGCRACHALAPDEVAGRLGANKDIAPNLSRIADKTGAQWIYHWIRNPRGYSAIARMPSLRLSDDEARAVTAYLLTLGQRQATPGGLERDLADPANVAAGEGLVRKYGCAGCHDIPGMENEARIGVELSAFGSKTKEELFFGDRTDLPETWNDWTYYKLLEPRTYATKWIEQLMPQFDLAEVDIKALRAFLASRVEGKVPRRYVYQPRGEREIVAGQRLVARYNCTGCHTIEGAGGDIRRLYAAEPTLAPPNLAGEGAKVQADWLFGFVKDPGLVQIRPWLKIRMPTFGLSDAEADQAVDYFGALDRVEVPFVFIDKAAFKRENLEAGKLLASRDYFDCFSCHQRGAQKPAGPPSDWAPDLSMAHVRLNPEWIVDWIRDPQKLMPGTKMPSFYPGGPPDVLGGDDEAQIRALRDYILSLGLPDTTPSPQQAAGVATNGPGAGQ
jgi:mono/diheme cytochrome c family protein